MMCLIWIEHTQDTDYIYHGINQVYGYGANNDSGFAIIVVTVTTAVDDKVWCLNPCLSGLYWTNFRRERLGNRALVAPKY